MKLILKNINITIIIIMIILSSIYIGTPINENNALIIYIIISLYSILYFIIKLKYKEKIKINKLDIYIGIILLGVVIPIIARTYITLNGAIYVIIKYISILNLYFITKNECEKEPKNKEKIINAIIFTIVLLCVIGIDEISRNYLNEFKNNIGYNYVEYDEKRISSLFSYPNSMAAITGLGVFLCVSQIYTKKRAIIKIMYFVMIIIMLITMVLTYSRLVYIIFTFMVFIYIIVLLKKYKYKMSKKMITSISIMTILMLIYILIGLYIPKQLKIEDKYQKILYTIEPNKDYNFLFNIDAISTEGEKYTIKLTEKNKYFDDIKITEVKIGSYSGEKEINIHTQDSTTTMYLNIEADINQDSEMFIIKNAHLNNEDFILEYKLLPTKIVEKIKSISFANKSVWERITFQKDALKLIKENIIFGLGGNAWRYMQGRVQEYNYYSNEVHSFPIQIFLENGIIGFSALIALGICFLKEFIKQLKQKEINIQKVTVMFGVIFISLHSLLDFNMSFFYIMLITFLIIAILNIESNDQKCYKINEKLYLLIIIVSLFTLFVSSTEYYYKENKNIIKTDPINTKEKIFEKYSKWIPFNKEIKINKYKALKSANKINIEKIQMSLQDIIKTEKYISQNVQLEYILEYTKIVAHDEEKMYNVLQYIYGTEKFYRYNPSMQINRFQNLEKIIRELEEKNEREMADKCKIQLQKEVIEKESYILDYDKSRYDKDFLQKYKGIINKIKQSSKI